MIIWAIRIHKKKTWLTRIIKTVVLNWWNLRSHFSFFVRKSWPWFIPQHPNLFQKNKQQHLPTYYHVSCINCWIELCALQSKCPRATAHSKYLCKTLLGRYYKPPPQCRTSTLSITFCLLSLYDVHFAFFYFFFFTWKELSIQTEKYNKNLLINLEKEWRLTLKCIKRSSFKNSSQKASVCAQNIDACLL